MNLNTSILELTENTVFDTLWTLPMDSWLAGPNLTNSPWAWSRMSHDCLELQYVLIDLSVEEGLKLGD